MGLTGNEYFYGAWQELVLEVLRQVPGPRPGNTRNLSEGTRSLSAHGADATTLL